MSNGEGKDKDELLEIDLTSFELQIDQEIDNLFVPAGAAAEKEEPPTPTAEPAAPPAVEQPFELEVAPEPAPARPSLELDMASESLAAPSGDIDLGALELKIDQEIDNLFVPASAAPAPDDDLTTEATAGLPLEAAPEPPPVAAPAFPTEGLRLDLDQGEKEPAVDQEIVQLYEDFHVAYLSLDWEFSLENIESLDAALRPLSPCAQKSREGSSLNKLLKAILNRLKGRTDSSTPELIQLLREGHDLLRPVLVDPGPVSSADKERLRTLITRFQAVREQAAPVEAPRPAPIAMPAAPQPVAFVPVGTGEGLEPFCQWMESFSARIGDVVTSMETESQRLQQIEKILGKTQALAPLTARLNRIRLGFEAQLSTVKLGGAECRQQLDWLRASGSLAAPAVETAPPRAVSDQRAPAAPEPLFRKEQVFYFEQGGKRFGVLAAHVVKIQPLSSGKARQIIQRGYATLGDFKPFLRSIKTGLFGAWNGMPADTLKGYRFMALPTDVLGNSGEPKGAILLSTGSSHGILFTDSAAIDLHSDTEIRMTPGNDAVLGVIGSETGTAVQVLDADGILSQKA